MTKVDIVVPCYNYGRFLESCVNSVLSQSIQDIRVLIIDDASTDDSLTVADRLYKADPRVTVLSHEQNMGHISTYNEGIKWASSDYFLLLSADDMLVPGALERATAIMDANPDVVLTHGKCVVWDDSLPPPQVAVNQCNEWTRHDLIAAFCAPSAGNIVEVPTAISRTSVQKSIGGYSLHLPHCADIEMWLRLAAHGTVARLEAVQAIYRRHTTNMHYSYSDRPMEKIKDSGQWGVSWPDVQERKNAIDSFFRNHLLLDPSYASLHSQATRVLAEKAFWCAIAQLFRRNIKSSMLLFGFAIQLRPIFLLLPPMRCLLSIPEFKERIKLLFAETLENRKRRIS